MPKITRKDALAAGLGTYTTGKPCKYGHLSYRYTLSGACAECISEASATAREAMRGKRDEFRERLVTKRNEQLQPVFAARQAKADALKRLTSIRVPVHRQNLSTVFDTAVELCIAAFPAIERSDVYPDSTPIRGTPLYLVRVPADQVDLMRQVADALWNAGSPNVSGMAGRVAAQIEQMANDEADEPPDGWK